MLLKFKEKRFLEQDWFESTSYTVEKYIRPMTMRLNVKLSGTTYQNPEFIQELRRFNAHRMKVEARKKGK